MRVDADHHPSPRVVDVRPGTIISRLREILSRLAHTVDAAYERGVSSPSVGVLIAIARLCSSDRIEGAHFLRLLRFQAFRRTPLQKNPFDTSDSNLVRPRS